MNTDELKIKKILETIKLDKTISEIDKEVSISTIRSIYPKYRYHQSIDVWDIISFIIGGVLNKSKDLENRCNIYKHIKDYERYYLKLNYKQKVDDKRMLSLDLPMSDVRDVYLKDVIPTTDRFEDIILNKIFLKDLYKTLNYNLTNEEWVIIQHRFGLLMKKAYTQREVANLLNKSQAHVSRVEKKVLRRLNKILSINMLRKAK